MPSFKTTRVEYGGEDEDRQLMREHFIERSSGWDCRKCAAYVNGHGVQGPQKHLAWHEAIGG